MKTATESRKLVTYQAYVKAKTGERMNSEQQEAFGRDVYMLSLVAVLDSGFSVEAKLSFPRMRGDFSLPNLEMWGWEFNNWFANLSRPERKLFLSLKFVP